MVVNFRARGISRGARKLVRIPMLNSKKKISFNSKQSSTPHIYDNTQSLYSCQFFVLFFNFVFFFLLKIRSGKMDMSFILENNPQHTRHAIIHNPERKGKSRTVTKGLLRNKLKETEVG